MLALNLINMPWEELIVQGTKLVDNLIQGLQEREGVINPRATSRGHKGW